MKKLKLSVQAGLLVTLLSLAAQAAAPEVLKVEPPNWWASHSINPVRVMIQGRNLASARVEAVGAGLEIGETKPSGSGNYIFVDVKISPRAAAGRRVLRIITSSGTADASFEISPPLARQNRFQGFTTGDVIYFIMPDRFSDGDAANNNPAESPGMYSRSNPRAYHGGDLQGIINRLGWLKQLGITAIWTTPVYDNTSRIRDYEWGKQVTDYHGYGTVDFYRVEEHLGSLALYRELVDRAHALGIKVIQDQVANHTGPDHPWAKDAPTETWLNGTLEKHLNNIYDIKSLTVPNPDRERYEATLRGWFGNSLPDINHDDAEAARYVIQNAVWWVEMTGLDGIRQDTFPYVPRRFWPGWNQSLKRAFPRLTVVGEVFDQRPEVVSFFQGGKARFDGIDTELYTVFDFPSYFAMRDVFIRNHPIKRLAEVLAQDHLYTNPRVLVTFLGNHDVTRFVSEQGARDEGLMLAFTYLLTMRGTPQIYSGDEIGLEGRDDPDNRRDFPGGFPGDTRSAFDDEGRTPRERKIFNHVKELTRLRARHPALREGDMRVVVATDTSLAYLRETPRERVMVAINNSGSAAEIEAPVPAATRVWVEASSGRLRLRPSEGRIRIPLKARDSIVLVER